MKFTFGILISAVCSVAVRTSTQSTLPTVTTTLSVAGSGQGSLKKVQDGADTLAEAAVKKVGDLKPPPNHQASAKKPYELPSQEEIEVRFRKALKERQEKERLARERGKDQQGDVPPGALKAPAQSPTAQLNPDDREAKSKPGNSQEAESETCQCCIMKPQPNQPPANQLPEEMFCQPCSPEPVNPLRRQSSSPSPSGRSSPVSPSETINPSVQNLEITTANDANESTGNRCKKCCCSKKGAVIGACVCVVTAAALGCNIM